MQTTRYDADLMSRARRMVAALSAYEERHPRQGADAQGRPYDPWRDVIADPWATEELFDGRNLVDAIRTRTIASRAWEGFAWANHRFVLSDEHGRCVIVGFNETAGRWFVDVHTPVRLPAAWVASFIAEYGADGRLDGLRDAGEVHEAIVRDLGRVRTTIPSRAEVEECLVPR